MMPRRTGSSPLEQADDVATTSSPTFDNDYKRVSCAGKDGDSVIWYSVTFEANVDPTFNTAQAVDKDNEWWMDEKNKLWSEESGAVQVKDEQIIERDDGGSGGGDNFMRLR